MAETAKKETAPTPRLYRVTVERKMVVLALSSEDAQECAIEHERDVDNPDAIAALRPLSKVAELYGDEKGSLPWISDEAKALLDPHGRPKLNGRYWEDFALEEWLDGRAQSALAAQDAEVAPEKPAPDHPGQGRIFPEAPNG